MGGILLYFQMDSKKNSEPAYLGGFEIFYHFCIKI